MNNKFNLDESLSALMDSEVNELELRMILKQIAADNDEQSLNAKWERYHLISSTLKQEVHTNPSVDLLSGIRKQLAQEPGFVKPAVSSNIRKPSKLFKSLGQGAIAASAALGVLFAVNLLIAPKVMIPSIATSDVINSLDANSLPEFNGAFKASELTRVVSFTGSERNRARNYLSQAVYRAFEETAEPIEISVGISVNESVTGNDNSVNGNEVKNSDTGRNR